MAAIASLVHTTTHHLGSFQENLHMLKTLAMRTGWIALSILALLPALALDTADTLASLFEGEIALPRSQQLATWQKGFSNPDIQQIGALFARTFLLLPLFAFDLGRAAYEKILDWILYKKSPEAFFFMVANRSARAYQTAQRRREIEELLAGDGEMINGDPPLNVFHYAATLTLFHVAISGENAPESLRRQIPELPEIDESRREAIAHAIYNFNKTDPVASQFFSTGSELSQNPAFMRMILSHKRSR